VLLGAHVSIAGGLRNAPVRGAEIGATAIQIFTKQANRWAEPLLNPVEVTAFRDGLAAAGIGFTCAHDSYLINLATPDPILRERSYESFRSELERCRDLGLNAVVTHPGNATDGDVERGIEQNADLIARALAEVEAPTRVLIETTAGTGSALGSSFEQLAALRARIPEALRSRVGVCIDSCHIFAAGYDLLSRYDEVIDEFDQVVGLPQLGLFHLNDSQKPLGSRRDRHTDIGEGTLGDEPFRRIMNDSRLAHIPRVLETPKGDDHAAADRMNLARLKSYLDPPLTLPTPE
jgi:deoxyribonuclease-4